MVRVHCKPAQPLDLPDRSAHLRSLQRTSRARVLVTRVQLIPKTAMDFYRAGATKDHAKTGRPVDHDFQLQYLDIRNREHGYAVSMFKADASL